ncbi:uncharacterized protein TNCV_4889121 [Trichonephila clavipes]|nr:uncharacterized protein TNCV_4889121 [Trichonephila clavipes]
MLSSVYTVTVEIRERFQQLQNPAQKYVVLRPEMMLSIDELNLDQAPQDINKEEIQLDCVRLQAFVAATDPGCKKELIRYDNTSLAIKRANEIISSSAFSPLIFSATISCASVVLLMRTETVETFELVKVKQKLLDIRAEKERERRTREVREQALPSEYHRQTYL